MNLKEESDAIALSFEDYKAELLKRKEDCNKRLEVLMEEYNAAVAQGDRSENAAFTAALEGRSKTMAELGEIMSQLAKIRLMPDINSYRPVENMVVMFSTVLLENLNDHGEMVYRIYPSGISNLERKIMSEDSPVGKMLLFKYVGDTITREMPITGEVIEFSIKGVY